MTDQATTTPTPESKLVARLRGEIILGCPCAKLLPEAAATIERLASAHEQGRREGIEMAAKACDNYERDGLLRKGYVVEIADELADAIRTLSSAPPGENGK